jgi:A/G-specific adenine glycosylase
MSLEKELCDWYQIHHRSLPWRDSPTPYHVYLSEIMCQQTQVDTVKAYYLRFLSHYPDFSSLAKASEEEVLKLWEGLGYYSRGRNLRKTALEVVDHFDGALPEEKKNLLSLPGIGEYTARAIRAMAFHQKEIAVDGNLVRVYSRLAEQKEPSFDKMKDFCEGYFKKELVHEDPSFFNQALMDLGEMVCLPNGVPLCDSCPLKAFCKSHQDGTMLDYPPAKKAKEKKQEEWTILLLRYGNQVALLRRPESGLLAGLYQFPALAGKLSLQEAQEALQKRGYSIEEIVPLGEAKHVFSHLVWSMVGYSVRLKEKPNEPSFVYADKKEIQSRYPLPTAYSFYKKKIGKAGV